MILRGYQNNAVNDIYQAWEQYRNVLTVLPTGAGKTVLFSNILQQHNGACVAIAHRQELVGQISMALARFGVYHRIIGNKDIIRWVTYRHISELGRSFYDPGAQCAVAGVLTLLSRKEKLASWLQQVTLWIIDEGHHLQIKNSWGKAVALFPNAKGLAVTATACRADGHGLGSHNDGVIDYMIVGPSPRDLINQGYLCDYRIFAPPSDLDLTDIKLSVDGDYNKKQLKTRVRKSHIIGDIVEHYLKIAPGKLGITFATDVETAGDISKKYRDAGVSSEVVSAKTSNKTRVEILKRFARREIMQLVNVDLFGEGFDLPALEVVSMGRPTESYGLFCQQFGRALRPLEDKKYAIIIDHVGNVVRHGLPDAPRQWSLERRERRTNGTRDPDMIPVRTCQACTGVYEAYYKICPYCGFQWIPGGRSTPEQVDGDLEELTPEILAIMRGKINSVDESVDMYKNRLSHGLSGIALLGAVKHHRLRQEAVKNLRNTMALWAGYQQSYSIPREQWYTRFYLKFGVDVMTAQTLKRRDTEDLNQRIQGEL